MHFTYQGLLDDNGKSWNIVGKELLLALYNKGCTISAVSINGVIGNDLKAVLSTESDDCIGLTYTVPSNFALRLNRFKHKLAIYNYETTVLPKEWVDIMNSSVVDYILPSSEFSKKIFINNNVNESKLKVIPHGVNTTRFNPNIPAMNVGRESFKFLTVAEPHVRKGFDILIEAFAEEFASVEDVCLIIKTTLKDTNLSYYEVNVKQILDSVRSGTKSAAIRFLSNHIDNLASLYNACDCVVLPTRSECFSLTTLEALACMKPVITTSYGGHMDYLTEQSAYLINYQLVPASQKMQYWHFSPRAVIAEPDKQHLRELMRYVYTHREEAKEKALYAYQNIVPKYTWENAAEQLIEFVSSLGWAQKPVERVDKIVWNIENKTSASISFITNKFEENKDEKKEEQQVVEKIKDISEDKQEHIQLKENLVAVLDQARFNVIDPRSRYAPPRIKKQQKVNTASRAELIQAAKILNASRQYIRNVKKQSVLKIGIYRTGGYGDAVLASAAIAGLKRKYPNSHIAVYGNDKVVHILKDNPYVDEAKVAGLTNLDFRMQHDIWIDLNPGVLYVEYFTNDYSNDRLEVLRKRALGIDRSPDKNLIDIQNDALCIQSSVNDIYVHITDDDMKFVEHLKKVKYVTVHDWAFGGRQPKCWYLDRWEEVIKYLKELGYTVYQVGAEEEDKMPGAIHLLGKLTFNQAVALVKDAAFHIDNESTFAHITPWLKVPTIVLYGPTYRNWLHKENINIEAGDCHQCEGMSDWWRRCPKNKDCECMKAITVDMVIKQIDYILSTANNIRRPINFNNIKSALFISTIDFDYMTQRPQHLAKEFALREIKVDYLNANRHKNKIPKQLNDNLRILFREDDIKSNYDIVWINQPLFHKLLDKIKAKIIVFDCNDIFNHFRPVIPIVTKKADLVVTTSNGIRDELKQFHNNIIVLNNACSSDFLDSSVPTTIPDDFVEIVKKGKPIIGYVGVVATWTNHDLFYSIAVAKPEWEVVVIGPVEKVTVKRAPNLHYLGEKPFNILRSYMSFFDVALISFIKSKLTDQANPVKLYEYLALGLPVVSTYTEEINNFRPLVRIGNSNEEIINHISQALEEKDIVELKEIRKQYARLNTWSTRVDQLNINEYVDVIIVNYNTKDMT